MTALFEILNGLPPTGPMHENFSATGQGLHSEGLVVRFILEPQASWVGNFQRGQKGLSGAYLHPNRQHVIVLAEGLAYIVDPEAKSMLQCFGGSITDLFEIPEKSVFIVGDAHRLGCLTASGPGWKSERISWDGIRNLRVSDELILGEAFSPITNDWTSFSVELGTGAVRGVSYDGGDE